MLSVLPIIAGINLITFGYIFYEVKTLMVVAGIICFIAGVALIYSTKKIYPKPISKHGDYYRLRGAHPDFLAHFPPAPR